MTAFSAEHRAKLSEAHRGKPLSDAHRAALGSAMRRPEVRRKLSEAGRGRPLTPEHRAAIRSSMLGLQKSDEHRSKIRDGMRSAYQRDPALRERGFGGHTHTPETRQRLRAAKIAAYDRDPSLRTHAAAYVLHAPLLGECVYCFAPAQTIDHVIPRGRPGWDDPGNLLPACWSCNASKGKRTPDEWFALMAGQAA